jgi:hypothetical protein
MKNEKEQCIVCDLQLLMYHCSFSFFIWPLYCLWFIASDVSLDNAMVKWKMKKNNDTSEAVNHRQYNGQMKNEKEHWYIRSCRSQTMQWSNEKWKRLHCLWFTASDVSVFFFIFHLTIALSVINSFWCMSVLFHFSFDHCIVYDIQLMIHQKLLITDNAMVKWKMKKNTDTSEAVNHRQYNGQTIVLSVIYSFWCISVLFHFSFDHCIFCDLQLLMYQWSFSFFIWPLHCLKWKMKKNNDTSEAVNHWQCNGQMKYEKEHWYIRSC